MNPYYLGSPTAPYLANYMVPPQLQYQQQQHQQQGPRHSGSSKAARDGRKGSPRIGAEKSRSASMAATSDPSIVQDWTGWKMKMRAVEMDAERSAKELEIARWRLAVLEEEQRTAELEVSPAHSESVLRLAFPNAVASLTQSQEALRALATRAMRAEARIKLLEEARAQDSSSASDSCSPATRPSSIAGSSELPSDPLPLPAAFDESDSVRLDSPPGVKVSSLFRLSLSRLNSCFRPI
jgi:hypothetical protein